MYPDKIWSKFLQSAITVASTLSLKCVIPFHWGFTTSHLTLSWLRGSIARHRFYIWETFRFFRAVAWRDYSMQIPQEMPHSDRFSFVDVHRWKLLELQKKTEVCFVYNIVFLFIDALAIISTKDKCGVIVFCILHTRHRRRLRRRRLRPWRPIVWHKQRYAKTATEGVSIDKQGCGASFSLIFQ